MIQRRPIILTFALLLLAAGKLPAQAPAAADGTAGPAPATLPVKKPETDGKVWGALIYASNDSAPLLETREQPPAHFDALQKRLTKVFPYSQFEIIGQHLQDIFREYESWVVPSKDLFLKIDSKGPADGGGMNLHLQFWREQQVLVKTDTILRPGSPLFIGGPKWRDGQLIFVLLLEKTAK